MDGLRYKQFTYGASKVHLLAIDLERRSVRPVMAAESFPIHMGRPVPIAIAEGALAMVGSGFNLLTFHDQGVSDQPLHALVVDGEIWTTGVGAGGYGLLLGDGVAHVQRNAIQVHVWNKGKAWEVESVNLGHPKIAAFTPRGGTNDIPDPTKHLYPIGDTVIESRWPLPQPLEWKQNLGLPDVKHIVSGWPQIVKDGQNIVPFLNMDPEAPHGPDNWFLRIGPRMALGVSGDHKTLFMCVIEGRIASSRGLRLKALANLMLHHGVYDAVNMDGGGSAFMVINGTIVSDSCYGNGTIGGLRPDHYCVAAF